MKIKFKYWLKQAIQLIVMVLIVGVVVDVFRRPSEPLNAANMPFTTLYHPQTRTLKDFSAKQTSVLYFWGSWCGICKHTSPVMNDLQADGIPILGVAWGSGSNEDVKQYLQKQDLHFDNINDEHGTLSQQWGVKVTPTIILIKNGKMIHSTTGLASYWGLRTRIFLANWVS